MKAKLESKVVYTRMKARALMEAHLGRPLVPGELIHHKDGNVFNNTIGNLQVMSKSEHNFHHKPSLGHKSVHSEKWREAMRKSVGRPYRGPGFHTKETVEKISQGVSEAIKRRKEREAERQSLDRETS